MFWGTTLFYNANKLFGKSHSCNWGTELRLHIFLSSDALINDYDKITLLADDNGVKSLDETSEPSYGYTTGICQNPMKAHQGDITKVPPCPSFGKKEGGYF